MEFPWGTRAEGSDDFFSYYVAQQVSEVKNLASEVELHEQARIAHQAYVALGTDDGELSFKQLKQLCEGLGLPLEASEEEDLGKKDRDGSNTLDVDELMTWWLLRVGCLPNPAKQQEALARNTFKKFDTDGSGELDMNELRELFVALGATFSKKEMEEVMQQLDTSDDGLVDEDEFVEWWTNRSLNNRRGGGLLALKLRKLASKAQQLFSTDIFTAAWQGDLELVKLFIQSEPRSAQAQDASEFGDGWSPLHYCAYRGHIGLVRFLIESAGDNEKDRATMVNKRNDKGFTPLFYAAQMTQPEICQMLLDAGADPTLSGVSDEFGEGEVNLVSLCPADLSADFSELDQALRAHDKCSAPDAIPADKVEASLSGATLAISLPSSVVRQLCLLPIRKWKIEMDCGSSTLVPVVIFAPNPVVPASNQSQRVLFSVAVDRKWLRSALSEMGENIVLTFTIAAVNALRDEGPFSDVIPVAYSAPAQAERKSEAADESKAGEK